MEKKKKSLFASLVAIIAIMVAILVIFSPRIRVEWSQERIDKANEGITYSTNGSYVDVVRGAYDWGRGGYIFDTTINITLYNSTEYELDEVEFSVYYEHGGDNRLSTFTLTDVPTGKTTLSNYTIDTFNDLGFTETDHFFCMYYEVNDDEIGLPFSLVEKYTDPENPPEEFSALAFVLVSAATVITFICGILLLINIISIIKNRHLVEYVSTSFFEEQEEPVKDNSASSGLVCAYCGNEFSKPYDKCPCCGARLKKKK